MIADFGLLSLRFNVTTRLILAGLHAVRNSKSYGIRIGRRSARISSRKRRNQCQSGKHEQERTCENGLARETSLASFMLYPLKADNLFYQITAAMLQGNM